MKASRILAAVAVAALALNTAACATKAADPVAVLDALGRNYAHCDRDVQYAATIGPVNPASGASVTGRVHCPAQPVGVATPGAVVGTDQPPTR